MVTETQARAPFRLDGRVVFITGAGSERGIGRAMSLVFAAAGARVALVDLDVAGAERNAAVVRKLGGEAAGFGVDVTDASSVRATVEAAEAALGRSTCWSTAPGSHAQRLCGRPPSRSSIR
jgi:NAD(P)-dependent dehydrogenase (short-subunit alcohol dehydrogenase family)